MACCKESRGLSALLGCKIGIYELFLLKFSDMDFFFLKMRRMDGWEAARCLINVIKYNIHWASKMKLIICVEVSLGDK